MLPIIGYLAFVGLSSFSLVSADDGSFLAFPKDRTNSKQTNDTDTAIKQLIGAGKVYSYVSQYYGVAFWLAPMSTDQQKKIQALPGVSPSSRYTNDRLMKCSRLIALPSIISLLQMIPLFQPFYHHPNRKARLVGFRSEKVRLIIDKIRLMT